MHKSDFTGTGKVYAFTLQQFFRGTANIVTLVILLLMALFSVPTVTLLQGGGQKVSDDAIETAYVYNETGLDLDLSTLDVSQVQETSESVEALGEDQAEIRFYVDETGYQVSVRCRDTAAGNLLAQQARTILEDARYGALGATEAQLDTITGGFTTQVDTVSGYLDSTKLDFDDAFAIQYVYAILVMILSLFSSAYIVRTVIEEKSSKLVETLMVSVRPLALIVGKILAVMTYMFAVLAGLALAIAVSYVVTGMFLTVQSPFAMLEGMGLNLQGMHIGVSTIFIVVISLLLGYFTFAILGGLFGTACSSMEDMESANLTVVLMVMAGYMVSCFTAGVDSRAFGFVVSYVPVASIFCAPVQYVCGNIGFGALCGAWVVQLAVLALLAWFCARIYQALLLYRGSRVKLSGMLKLARQQKGGRAQ